jgi:hypothetical protein
VGVKVLVALGKIVGVACCCNVWAPLVRPAEMVPCVSTSEVGLLRGCKNAGRQAFRVRLDIRMIKYMFFITRLPLKIA